MSVGLLTSGFEGRYVVERELGRGASAVVYLARDTVHDRLVAIKILRRELSETLSAERFQREIRVTAALQHPRILPVLDSGAADGRLYFVLPYMDGGTLRARFARHKQLPIGEVVRIGATIAEALEYAHARNVVHRDVKPENILFSGNEPYLADFGIARAIERSLEDSTTSTGIVHGTPAYMSPEQATGERGYDGRSDIYSLGCVLYEAVAGMPAFVGPTPQSVVAQRLAHMPRPLRVYRPQVPQAMEAVIEKALATAAADRYQTAGELAAALTIIAPGELPRSLGPATRTRVAVMGLAFVAILAAGGVAVRFASGGKSSSGDALAVDTARIVLLPIEGGPPSGMAWRHDDLLQDGVMRWRDIWVVDQFQVADALRRQGHVTSVEQANVVAASLGAGRYIRTLATPRGNAWHVTAALFDVAQRRSIHQAAVTIPHDLEGAVAAYGALADSLLLRGAAADSVPLSGAGSRSLPAVQAFGAAQHALDDWNLAGADSAFQQAVNFDPGFARARVWLAQVRAWQDQPPVAWIAHADHALQSGDRLTPRELLMMTALVQTARGEYDAACRSYDRLRERNDRDFAAWFGRGQCRMADRIVVRDSASPSGWRFRQSSHEAMQSFTRAFEILPSVHRGYERGAFERLRRILLLSDALVNGFSIGDSTLFHARPAWMGDSLVLVPYPADVIARGGAAAIPPGFERALERRRAAFRRIAAGWSAAYPRSAGAKEAVAFSLEMLGDPAAVDTMRAARDLARDPARRIHLGAAEAHLLFKFGLSGRPALLDRALVLADSLTNRTEELSGETARALVGVAALIGRCDSAERLIRAGQRPSAARRLSPELYTNSQVLLIRATLGCGVPPHLSVAALASEIERLYGRGAERDRTELILLLRPALFGPDPGRAILARLAASGNQLILARLALQGGDSVRARGHLEEFEAGQVWGTPTPDVLYPAARLWASAGDTARAVRTLDQLFEAIARYEPGALSDTRYAGAAVGPAIRLRVELARALGQQETARDWSMVLARMWSRADPPLRELAERITTVAGR